jgi:hypothetical protein
MTRAALLLMATTLAISTAAAKDSESPPDSLATRIEETRDGDLAVNDLAILLLEAEVDAVTAWLKDVSLASNEATSPRSARPQRLLTKAKLVPGILRGLISRQEIPAEARAHALAVGVEILHAGGTPADFRQLVRLVTSAGKLDPRRAGKAPSSLRRCLLDATSLRLYSFPDLERLYQVAPDPLARAILDGVAGGADPEYSARALARLLGLLPARDPAVLNRLHLALQRARAGSNPGVADRVAPYLDDARTFARHEAAGCLARTGERAHVQPLIERLEDSELAVRIAAQTALHELTGMALPAHPQRWRGWFDEQLAWWDSEGQSQLDELRFASRTGQLTILRDVSTKRLFHDEIAEGVAELLRGGDAATQCLALSALGTLRSPSTLDLVDSYEAHPDPDVRAASRAALRSYQQAQTCRSRSSGSTAR